MRIALGRPGLRVPQQLTNNRKPEPATSANAGVGMPQIMKPDADEAAMARHHLPRPFEVRPWRIGVFASDDEGADAGELGEAGQRRRVQDDGLAACLAVREQQQSALEIDMLPSQMQNFAQPCTSKYQQPQSRRGMRADDSAAVVFWNVLGAWTRLVNVPCNAECLAARIAAPMRTSSWTVRNLS